MSTDIKIYKIKDFVRFNESGEIDFERSMQMAHGLALAASQYTGHNILTDLRETTIVMEFNIGMILELASEIAFHVSSFKGKMELPLSNRTPFLLS